MTPRERTIEVVKAHSHNRDIAPRRTNEAKHALDRISESLEVNDA
jgi:hypothetical protein